VPKRRVFLESVVTHLIGAVSSLIREQRDSDANRSTRSFPPSPPSVQHMVFQLSRGVPIRPWVRFRVLVHSVRSTGGTVPVSSARTTHTNFFSATPSGPHSASGTRRAPSVSSASPIAEKKISTESSVMSVE
jgi:hypothetical protein